MEIELLKNRYQKVEDSPKIEDIFIYLDIKYLSSIDGYPYFYGIITDIVSYIPKVENIVVSWYLPKTNTINQTCKDTMTNILNYNYILYRDTLLNP